MGQASSTPEPPPAPVETPLPSQYATPNRERRERPPRTPRDPQDDILGKLKAALDAQERKVQSLEQENQKLKQQLAQMQKLMAISGASKDVQSGDGGNEYKEEKKSLDELTEGDIWNLVRSS